MINQLLKERLTGVTYQVDTCSQLSKELADEIKAKLKGLTVGKYYLTFAAMDLPRYKFVAHVMIGEMRGEGVRRRETPNITGVIDSNRKYRVVVGLVRVSPLRVCIKHEEWDRKNSKTPYFLQHSAIFLFCSAFLLVPKYLIGIAGNSRPSVQTPFSEGARRLLKGFKALLRPTIGPPAPIALPKTAAFQNVVKPLIAQISQPSMKSWLIRLTEFPERYYKSANGIASTVWIRDQANALAPVNGTKLTGSLFDHSWKAQQSVIVRYEATTPSELEGIVIAGTHFDSVGAGSGKPKPNNNPAADDCASGSTVIFEILRVLVANGFVPGLGLLGSNAVAEAYAKAGTKVVSYLNLDQSGYVRAGTTPIMGVCVWFLLGFFHHGNSLIVLEVVTDFTTIASTAFLRSIVTTYTKYNFVNTRCGYRCTDHAAWSDHGDRVNRDGRVLDTVDKLNFDHITEFIKSTLGYVVELSLTGTTQTPAGLARRRGLEWRQVWA
ncbi:hypothetical protein HDU67_009274 [Dinochytrium kinnereticum]|nr:hypothetical protein HDU67_009274 [Dinochytrium kinnereticum]